MLEMRKICSKLSPVSLQSFFPSRSVRLKWLETFHCIEMRFKNKLDNHYFCQLTDVNVRPKPLQFLQTCPEIFFLHDPKATVPFLHELIRVFCKTVSNSEIWSSRELLPRSRNRVPEFKYIIKITTQSKYIYY